MKSERLLRAGWALVAVLATAAHFALRLAFPSRRPESGWISVRGVGSGAGQAQPHHDRLRSPPGDRGTARPLADASGPGPRRSLGRGPRALPPQRRRLADV